MEPNEIKSLIVLKGVKLIDIASRANVNQSLITRAIYGQTKRIEARQAIADAIGKPVAEIWPGTETTTTQEAA